MIREKQTVFDLAVQRYGQLDFAANLVSLNRIPFDSDLPIDSDIESDENGNGDEEVKNKYIELNYSPVND